MREWLSGGAPPCQGGGRGRSPRSPGPRAPSRASFICSGSLDFTGFPLFLCLHEVVDS